jgi:hypothetical protein
MWPGFTGGGVNKPGLKKAELKKAGLSTGHTIWCLFRNSLNLAAAQILCPVNFDAYETKAC